MIALELTRLHANNTLFQGDLVFPEMGLHNFLWKTMEGGLLAAKAVMSIQDNVLGNKEDRNKLATQLVYHGTAGAMVCAGPDLPLNARIMTGQIFGKKTIVTLASGDNTDTISVRPPNTHSKKHGLYPCWA